MGELLEWWSHFHGCSDPRLDGVQAALRARLAADRLRFSEVFEASCSLDAAGWHCWRFSYAFPNFRSDPTADTSALLGFCRPFGAEVSGWVETLLSPVLEAAVSLPLVGLAYDAPASWRVKLYLQFRDEAGDAALGIAGRAIGRADLRRLFRPRSLHLLGIDLGPTGITGAKLYFRLPAIRSSDVGRDIGSVELIDYLAAAGVGELRNLLVIHRLRRADDPALGVAAEVDFALPENDLCWTDLTGSRTLRDAGGDAGAFAALSTAFAVGVRRVSVPVGRADKLNLYYVPTELDRPPAGDDR